MHKVSHTKPLHDATAQMTDEAVTHRPQTTTIAMDAKPTKHTQTLTLRKIPYKYTQTITLRKILNDSANVKPCEDIQTFVLKNN